MVAWSSLHERDESNTGHQTGEAGRHVFRAQSHKPSVRGRDQRPADKPAPYRRVLLWLEKARHHVFRAAALKRATDLQI